VESPGVREEEGTGEEEAVGIRGEGDNLV